MKLLFDHNLSPRLVDVVSEDFPNSVHVRDEGLAAATDREVWEFARSHDFTIVTKDSDFNDLVVLLGAPPKVVWIRVGNCTTKTIEILLREHSDAIDALATQDGVDLLELQ